MQHFLLKNSTLKLNSKTMVKSLLVAAAFAASAGAFAPARQSRATTSLNEFANGYVGSESVEPMLFGLKSEKFDPLGFSEVCPCKMLQSTAEKTASTLHENRYRLKLKSA